MEQKKKVEKKNQEKKNEEKKAACVTVLKVLLCLVLAIFLAEVLACAGVCVKNGYQAESFVRFAVKSRSIEADELQVNGYQVTEDGTFISQSNDACFIPPDLNTKVENVVLSFSEPLANDLGVKVYYDENGQGLNEKNTRVGVAEANTSYLEIPLSKRVINLRIDIGETQSDQFVLDRVMINHFNWLHKDAVYYGIMIFIVLLVFLFWESKTVQFVYKRRYYAAALVCALGILLQLHGASINYWSNIYGASVYDEIPTNVFGTTRAVRGDDWAAFTSMAFSQEYNDYGYLTDRIGIHDKDVSIVYGQPVKSIAGLFRPELWGYILLGSVRGLSFFWIVRAVALFMVSWEFGRLITGNKRRLSMIYAAGVLLSPVVQWWYGTNGLIEMLVFGQLAVLLLEQFFHMPSVKKRILLCTGICYCGVCYALVFYPAWQIPFTYVFLFMVIWLFAKYRKFPFSKVDIPIWIGNLAVFGGMCLFALINSRDAIETTIHTVYPGSRFSTGGGAWQQIFCYWSNIFLPHNTDIPLATNVCEVAGFTDLAPFGIILAVLLLIQAGRRKEKKDFLLLLLTGFVLAGLVWYTVGFPSWLCRIMLLFPVTSFRGLTAIQFAQWILLIRALSLKKEGLKPVVAIPLAAFAAVLMYTASKSWIGAYVTGIMPAILIGYCLLAGIGVFMKLSDRAKNVAGIAWIVMMLFAGLLVNPVVRGADAVYENKLLNEVKAEVEAKDELWAFDGVHTYMGTSLLTVGAKSLNAIQVYPDLSMWYEIDPDRKYEEVYNRYQHIRLNIVPAGTSFRVLTPDSIEADLCPENLKQLGVEKIVTKQNLEELNDQDVTFAFYKEIGSYKIYQLN